MQSTDFDPGILSIYTVVYRLYRLCDFSTSTNGIITWSFANPDARDSIEVQECIRSLDHFKLPYIYRVESELFGNPRFAIDCSMRKLWIHMFSVDAADRLCEAISPRRSPRKRSPKTYH